MSLRYWSRIAARGLEVDDALREDDLLNLVGDRPQVAEVEDLRELHGYGAGSLRGAAGDVGKRRRCETGHVDRALGPERLVLDGDDRLLDERGDVGERDRDARRAGRVEIRDQDPGAVVDQRVGGERSCMDTDR